MKAMILCAGSATRLRSVSASLPKCMLDIGGVPLLERTIRWLHSQEITELVINLCYLPDAIRGYFGDGSSWGVHIEYSFEPVALGTAGGVRNAIQLLGENEPFIVWYGDNLSRCDLHALSALHQASGAIATVGVFQRKDPWASGIVEFDAASKVARVVEKPKLDETFSNWVNAGIMVCHPKVLDLIPNGASDFGHDILPCLVTHPQGVYAYRLRPAESLFWIDTPSDLVRVQRLFAHGSWPGHESGSLEDALNIP